MFDPDAIIEWTEQLSAQLLMANAIKLQVRHKRNLSVANPRPHTDPSQPGEFPKARTYNLRDSVAIEPRSLAVIARTGMVRVGVLVSAIYGEYLTASGRKGIVDTHNELKAMGAYRNAGSYGA